MTVLPFTYVLRNLLVRSYSSMVTGAAMALMVATFAVLMGVIHGFDLAMQSVGNPSSVVISSREASSTSGSYIPRGATPQIKALEGIATEEGRALVSEEFVKADYADFRGEKKYAVFRGVSPIAFRVHNETIVSPANALPLKGDEVIVGSLARTLFKGLNIGHTIHFAKRSWKVRGFLEARGNIFESEFWVPLEELLVAYDEHDVSLLTAKVSSPDRVEQFVSRLNENPVFSSLYATTEKEFFSILKTARSTLKMLAAFISFLLFTGVAFGTFITIFNNVQQRRREIGILRGIGFSKRAIVSAFLLESALLAISGGSIGCLLGLLPGQLSMRVAWGQMQLAFRTHVTFLILAEGLLLALLVGVLVGFLASITAARSTVTETVRNL